MPNPAKNERMSNLNILAQEYIKAADEMQAYVDKLKLQRKGMLGTLLFENSKKIKIYEDMIYDLRHNASTMLEYYKEAQLGLKDTKKSHKLP